MSRASSVTTKKPESHKGTWECPKCRATYDSPLPILGIDCRGDKKKGTAHKAVDMKPSPSA